MELREKSQVFIFEIALLFLFFGGFFIYIGFFGDDFSNDFSNQNHLDSYLFSLIKNDSFKEKLFLENLSINSLSENWTSEIAFISDTYTSFDLSVSNLSLNKNLTSYCDSDLKVLTSSQLIAINQTPFEIRVITLGVCY